MDVHDLVDLQDEFVSYQVPFNLWPKRWKNYSDNSTFLWEYCKFDERNVINVPDSPGIYTFTITPGIASHPNRYLAYLGQTERSLKMRFKEYLREVKTESGRPKIVRLLTKWQGYIDFCYSVVGDNKLVQLEENLLRAFIPPFNSDFPGEISRVVRAF